MIQSFEYSHTERFDESIEVEDIGNTCISALKDTPFGTTQWYLIIDTNAGWSHIRQFGPLQVEEIAGKKEIDSGSFHYNFYNMEFNERNIGRIITTFLQKQGGDTFQAFEVDKEEAYKYLDFAIESLKGQRNASN